MANELIIHKNSIGLVHMGTITLTELKQIFWLYLISYLISYASSQQYLDYHMLHPELSHINSVSSFTLDIESDIYDNNDLFIRTYWFFSGRKCLKPKITFIFEEIDQDQIGEYIEIYADNKFTLNITKCKSLERACGSMKTCLNKHPFPNIDITSTLEIGIKNSANVHALCYNPKRTIRAELTITCGSATAKEHDATKTFDLSGYNALNPPKTTYQYYTNNIVTIIGAYYWTLYDASLSFIGTPCYEPTLTFSFEDVDFEQPTEWLEIYAPDFITNVTRCNGVVDGNCGSQIQCLKDYKLYENVYTPYSLIPIGILKPDTVSDIYCGSTINVTITLRCSINIYDINKTVNVFGNNIYTLPLIQSTAAYDKNIKYNLHIKFTNGSCLNPKLLSLKFQETDFEDTSQSLEIYTSGVDSFLAKCIGSNDIDQCEWNECIDDFDFGWLTPTQFNEWNLLIVKSSNVKSLDCGYTLNAQVIIECTGNPTRSPSIITYTDNPTIQPTYSPTTEYIVTKATNSAGFKKQKHSEFDYYLILYGVIFILFGIVITICFLCIYKKCKLIKQRKESIGDTKSNRCDIKHNIQHPQYQSLKSNEYDDINNMGMQIEGNGIEMELMKKKNINIGEVNTFIENNTTSDEDSSIEEMFVERNCIQRQETVGGDDETPINHDHQMCTAGGDEIPINHEMCTRGLPKLEESTGVYSNCQQCALIKEGRNDKNDGLFYCFECWRDFEQSGN